MLLRAARGGLPGSLAHGMACGGAEAENALQAPSNAGNAGFNQEAVLPVHEQVFYSIQMRNHDGKTGGRGFVSNQGESLVEGWKDENVRTPEVRADIGLHADKFDPVAKLIVRAEARDQIRFTTHDDELEGLHARSSQCLHEQGQPFALELPQCDKETDQILVIDTQTVTKCAPVKFSRHLQAIKADGIRQNGQLVFDVGEFLFQLSGQATGGHHDLFGPGIGKAFHPGVELMVEPAEPTPQTSGARSAPVMLEVHAMAKVGVEQIAKREIALQRLDKIRFCAATEPVKPITEGGCEVINDE